MGGCVGAGGHFIAVGARTRRSRFRVAAAPVEPAALEMLQLARQTWRRGQFSDAEGYCRRALLFSDAGDAFHARAAALLAKIQRAERPWLYRMIWK
jgi:hypothetical protein